jgi:hypothetical protein
MKGWARWLALGMAAWAAPSATATIRPAPQQILPADVEQAPIDWSRLRAGHPRLFADEAQIAAIRAQQDPVSRRLKQLVMRHADESLAAAPIDYPPAGSNTEYPGPGGKFVAVRSAQGRVLALALAWRLTGEARYADGAKREVMRLAALPDWNPKHFLTLGEAALTVGIGYDWLYDRLAPDERTTLVDAIRDKALVPSLPVRPRRPDEPGTGSWLNADFNWNPVVNGSLATAALAIEAREPVLARAIVGRSVRYLPYVAATYAPDGAWPEAPNYWTYGTSYYAIAIEALRSALGEDYGLAARPGFLRTGDYAVQVVGPGGEDWNYSDYTMERQNEPVMLWLARETGRADLAAAETRDVERLAGEGRGVPPLNYSRHTPFELLWWRPALASGRAAAPPTAWTADGPVPMGILRSAWHDPMASFVAVKGGSPSFSHAHMDSGGFVMEAGGVRWAVDLSAENYDMMRRARLNLWNMGQDSDRWTTFRVGPEGHNILRFDDGRQRVDGRATLRRLPDRQGVRAHQVDLTGIYADRARAVSRTVKLMPDGRVGIADRWTMGDRPARVTFQWLTHARAAVVPGGVRMTQDGRTLMLRVRKPDGARIVIEDASAPRAPQDSPNPGLSRILIQTQTAAGRSGAFEIEAGLVRNGR